MAELRKPLVPEGPIRVFYERLHALHQSAGQPSMRDLQRRTRSDTRPRGINPTTIHDIFASPRLSRWEVVEDVVRQLGGDPDEFATMWRSARDAEIRRASDRHPASGSAYRSTDGAASHESTPPDPPRQLPPDVFAFTGRTEMLAELDRLLLGAGSQSNAVVIAVVSGTAGVGKTALAVHWAHRAKDRFPDGQLYLDLRGYDPDQPISPGDAVSAVLRTLGVPGADIPEQLAERASQFRSLTAGRRLLIVLDNANSVEQVRPLLPGTPSCLVLVTSRDSMTGLVARFGARRIDVDLLPSIDSVDLLRKLVGGRIDANAAAARDLAEACARLPLALRVAAERAAARPATPIAELVAEVSNEQRRLDMLDATGDERTAVQVVFSWSYRQLPPPVARAFRLLGCHPGPHLDGFVVAALVRADLDQARRTLDALAGVHLVERTEGERYTMHDLLRLYAIRLCAGEDDESDRRAALTRLLDYYLGTAARAMDVAFPAERQRRPRTDRPNTPTPTVDTPRAARSWLDAESAALVAAASFATRHGWPAYGINIATTLWRYLQNGARHADAITMHTSALEAARQIDDRTGEATALLNIGTVYWRWGQYDQAADSYERALGAFRQIDDLVGEARALTNLGAISWHRGCFDEAANSFAQAAAAFAQVGDRAGEARAIDNLGAVHQRQGRYEEAVELHLRALAMARAIADRPGEARALDNLGSDYQRQGRHGLAAEHHLAALEILREVGDRAGEIQVLDNLGTVHRLLGMLALSLSHHQRAVAIAREIGSRSRESSALNGLAETSFAQGDPSQAQAGHRAALETARVTGDRYEQARALYGIGRCLRVFGMEDQARQHLGDALAIFSDIAVPDAGEVSSTLDELKVDVMPNR